MYLINFSVRPSTDTQQDLIIILRVSCGDLQSVHHHTNTHNHSQHECVCVCVCVCVLTGAEKLTNTHTRMYNLFLSLTSFTSRFISCLGCVFVCVCV